MPTTIVGTDTFDASFNIPSGGDTRNAASVNVALEALANRTTYLKNRTGAERVVASAGYDVAGVSILASTSSASYSEPSHASVYSLNSITCEYEAGDIVEMTGFVIVGPTSTATTIYVRPGVYASDDASYDHGTEMIVTNCAEETLIPVHARIVLTTSSSDAADFIMPYLALKSGTGGNEVNLFSPSSITTRIWRANT